MGRRIPQARVTAALLALLAMVAALVTSSPAAADHATRRWAGGDRIATAVEVSRRTFPDGASVVVLASRSGFADALSAGPLAGALGGPVLLAERDRLPTVVADELDRLRPRIVYVMGGPRALDEGVREAAAGHARDGAERLAGSTRHGTAAAAARLAVQTWRSGGDDAAGRRVLVALGDHRDPSRAWPDALAAGVAAGTRHDPLLLVTPGAVPAETRDAIAALGVREAVVVGGPAAIPDATADQLGVPWTRASGTDRYATGATVTDLAVAAGADPGDVTIVTGRDFPDALGAVPSALARGGVLLLLDGRDLDGSPASRAWLGRHRDRVRTVTVVGGPGAVADAVLAQVSQVLDGTAELRLALEPVVDADTALALRSDPGQPDVLYVAERAGRILRVDTSRRPARVTTFLDVRNRVATGGERGLLDLVLHPDFAANGRLYLHYSGAGDGRTVLAEHRRQRVDPTVADPDGVVLFEASQPASNHNGGGLAFLPDGTLLLALGDGGGANDQYRNGQDRETALGSLLRFEVPAFGAAVPARDNPYVDGPGRDEIWATGLRNPFRITVDAPSGTLYVADVGQDRWEEVNAVPVGTAGIDYGWSTMEGPDCFVLPTCDRTGLTLPAHAYEHGQGNVCSITGGHVHRGSIVDLRGHYVFGDFCSGDVWTLRLVDGRATEVRSWPSLDVGNVYSFGADARGEVYVMGSGTVYRIVEG